MRYRLFLFALFSVLCLSGCGDESSAHEAQQTSTTELIEVREELESAVEVYVPDSQTNIVGGVMYYPSDGEYSSALAGTNCLSLFFKNSNVTAGTGAISLFERDTLKKVASIQASDAERCIAYELSSDGKEYTGFPSGTQVDLYFETAFLPGKSYFVLMDEGCFNLGRVSSRAVTDANLIVFNTKTYGFEGDMRSIYHVNDFSSFSIIVDGACVKAEIAAYDEADLSIATPVIERKNTLVPAVNAKPNITMLREGILPMTVSFYDNQQELLETIYVEFECVAPDVEIEELLAERQLHSDRALETEEERQQRALERHLELVEEHKREAEAREKAKKEAQETSDKETEKDKEEGEKDDEESADEADKEE